MRNLRARVVALIEHQPVAAEGNSLTPGDLLGHHEHMAHDRHLARPHVGQ